MIVVDTNVIVYLCVRGEHSSLAQRIMRRDHAWAAPWLWRSEFRNVLSGYVRRGELPLDFAIRLSVKAEAQMRGREYRVSSSEVLKLAQESGCSAYDCEFVALARGLGVPLVTGDRRIVAAFPTVAVGMKKFAGSR